LKHPVIMQVLLATVRQRSALRGDWSLHEKTAP
jgi:hypothetical protein